MSTEPSAIVETSNGKLQGKRFTCTEGKKVDAFLGIPFAQPPVGELRFKKPQPPLPWKGVKEVTEFGPNFVQAKMTEGPWKNTPVSEDSLLLNVFSPTWTPPVGGFPVMVWVHGGAFLMGGTKFSGDFGICDALCTKDVVVVSIQYRLGYLGFWTTGDASCPDNLGLWDQTEALKWVQKNIGAFGGNKDNVTVLGQSAGGCSVDFLHLSPHATGLFHKVIPMAGNAHAAWAHRPNMVGVCEKRARKMGLEWSSTEELMRKLRELPAEDFNVDVFQLDLDDGHEITEVTPVLHSEFLPGSVSELRTRAKPKPVITGITQHESILMTIDRSLFTHEGLVKYVDTWLKGASAEEKMAFIKRFIDLEKTSDFDSVVKAMIGIHSENFANAPTLALVRDHLRACPDQPLFLYVFRYVNLACYNMLPPMAMKGATHACELSYLFGKGALGDFDFTDNDRKMLEMFSTAFTNFAKCGNPNGDDGKSLPLRWDPVDKAHVERHYVFDLKPEEQDVLFDGHSAAFLEVLSRCQKGNL